MKKGFTTGTCAAAAAKAAAFMLLAGQKTDRIDLQWQPVKGRSITVEFPVEDCVVGEDTVRCAVRKDAGDDIDVTDGLLICAKVTRLSEYQEIPGNDHFETGNVIRIANEDPLDNPGTSVFDDHSWDQSGDEEQIGAGPLFQEGSAEAGDLSIAENLPASAFGTGPAVVQEDPEKVCIRQPVFLSDLEDQDGIIPMRWDRAADFFKFAPRAQRSPAQGSPVSGNEGNHSGRIISVTEDGTFSSSEWSLIQELFQAAGESQSRQLSHLADDAVLSEQERFPIRGGEGIGIVTRPGLDQPPGEAAINSVPRRMIREAVASVCDEWEYEGRLQIEISAPGGKDLATRTFNPRLGIAGGISILGTTGIVEPMSGRAVSETVRAEVRVKASASAFLAMVPGNTGAEFVRRELLIPDGKIVMMSNYPGDALDEAQEAGVKSVLITGSLGKVIKLAGGIFHTHSRDADARLDILMRCAMKSGATSGVLRQLDSCVTTEAGLDILQNNSLLDRTAEVILNRAVTYTRHRAGNLRVEMIILRNSGEVLAFTDKAFSVMMEEQDV